MWGNAILWEHASVRDFVKVCYEQIAAMVLKRGGLNVGTCLGEVLSGAVLKIFLAFTLSVHLPFTRRLLVRWLMPRRVLFFPPDIAQIMQQPALRRIAAMNRAFSACKRATSAAGGCAAATCAHERVGASHHPLWFVWTANHRHLSGDHRRNRRNRRNHPRHLHDRGSAELCSGLQAAAILFRAACH